MPFEDTKILVFNQYKKSDKAPFIIYADLECIIEKIDGYKINPGNSSTTKVSENVYRDKDCMKTFCESLREHTMKIVYFKKKKMKLLTKKKQESSENAKICHICKKYVENKYLKDKKYRKVRDHCYYTGEYIGAAHNIFNVKYSVPSKKFL